MRFQIGSLDLAHLFLKNQYELRDIANQLLQNTPHRFALSLGTAEQALSMSVSTTNGVLHLAFTEGDRSYDLRMPMKPTQDLRLRVVLTEAGMSTEYIVKPEDFVDAKLSDGFKNLHSRVAQYLKTLVPRNFFDKKPAHAEASTAASVPAVSTPADQPSSTEATTSAASASDGTTSATSEVAPNSAADAYVTYVVSRPNERDLRFTGKEIASVESWPRNGRQHVYKLFTTPSGKHVGLKLGTSMWLGEQDRVAVQVADTAQELVDFFGLDPLAKALYTQLNMAQEEVID